MKYFKDLLNVLTEIRDVLREIDQKQNCSVRAQERILKRLHEVIKVDGGYHGR